MDRTKRSLFLLAVGGGLIWIGYLTQAVVVPLIAALLLAYVLDPIVRWLEGRGMSRAVASGLVVVVALTALFVVSILAVQRAVVEGRDLFVRTAGEPMYSGESRREALIALSGSEAVAAEVGRVDGLLREGYWADRLGFYLDLDGDGEQGPSEPEWIGQSRDHAALGLAAQVADAEVADTIRSLREAESRGSRVFYLDQNDDGVFEPGYARTGRERVEEFLREHELEDNFGDLLDHASDVGPQVASTAGDVLLGLAEGGRSALSTALGLGTLVILFPIYLFYSLLGLDPVWRQTVRHLPSDHRERVVEVCGRIHITLSAFFRGRLLTLIVKGALLLVVFLLFGVPFAFVCALFAAVASLVPVVGGIAAGAVPLVLSLSAGASAGELAGLLIALFAIEGIEGYLLIPALIGKQVGLHPLTVIVATFLFGDLLGIFGMLIAIPAAAVTKILSEEFVLPKLRRRAGISSDGAAGTGGTGGTEDGGGNLDEVGETEVSDQTDLMDEAVVDGEKSSGADA